MAYRDRSKNIGSIVIKKPHVTERATLLSGSRAYSFIVKMGSNKTEIKEAFEDIYKVRPVKVNIINVPEKKVFGRGRHGRRPGFKKAVVYLKEGDKIDLM